MPNKNIADTYDKLVDVLTIIGNELKEDLPQFTEAEFLESFGTKFQDQLSNDGKNTLKGILDQNVLNPALKIISKKVEEDFEEILTALPKNYLDTRLDLDITLKRAQNKLQKKLAVTKEQLLQNFLNDLNQEGTHFSPEDETKLKTTFTEYFDKKYLALNKHLEKFKKLPFIYTKYQSHQEFEKAQTKADKDVSHSITRDPKLKELQTMPKPEPTFGFKVDKKNLAEQIQSDIAAGENIDIKLNIADQSAIFKKMNDIGIQYQKPALQLFYLLIFLMTMYIYNNEKRITQSIKDVIKEKHLFDFDPSKITLQMTIQTPNGNEKVIRKKGPLNPQDIKKLESIIDENKKELFAHHYSTQDNKKSGLTPSESGYHTEEDEEEIPYSRPKP